MFQKCDVSETLSEHLAPFYCTRSQINKMNEKTDRIQHLCISYSSPCDAFMILYLSNCLNCFLERVGCGGNHRNIVEWQDVQRIAARNACACIPHAQPHPIPSPTSNRLSRRKEIKHPSHSRLSIHQPPSPSPPLLIPYINFGRAF